MHCALEIRCKISCHIHSIYLQFLFPIYAHFFVTKTIFTLFLSQKEFTHTFFVANTVYAFFSRKWFTHFIRKVFTRWKLPSGKFRLFGPLGFTNKKVLDLSGLPSQLINLANFIHFRQLICWWKIHDESLPLPAFFGQGHLPHPVASSKSQKRACFAPE